MGVDPPSGATQQQEAAPVRANPFANKPHNPFANSKVNNSPPPVPVMEEKGSSSKMQSKRPPAMNNMKANNPFGVASQEP